MREFTLGTLSESRSAPGGRQLVGQAANLTSESACRLLGRTFINSHLYYYSTLTLILIYRPSEGERLSRPRHCSKCAACAQSRVSQWFSWKHKLLPAARFDPGTSRTAGKRATSRSLRPVMTADGVTQIDAYDYDDDYYYRPPTVSVIIYCSKLINNCHVSQRNIKYRPGIGHYCVVICEFIYA